MLARAIKEIKVETNGGVVELDTIVTNFTTTNLNYKVMKTNEAPKKIYLTTDGNNSFVFTQKRSDNEGIEYTRTDVLIKKTEEYMYKQLNEGHIECANIGTFLENYKNFMKGE